MWSCWAISSKPHSFLDCLKVSAQMYSGLVPYRSTEDYKTLVAKIRMAKPDQNWVYQRSPPVCFSGPGDLEALRILFLATIVRVPPAPTGGWHPSALARCAAVCSPLPPRPPHSSGSRAPQPQGWEMRSWCVRSLFLSTDVNKNKDGSGHL